MKKLLMLIAVAILVIPLAVSAAEVKTAENISKDESPNNLYLAGQNPTIDAEISGDLVIAGGNVTINGGVEKNVIAAGGNVIINGPVGENVRVAAATVTINGVVDGDLIVFAGDVVIGKEAIISGDVIINARTFDLKGQVDGDIKNSSAGDVIISGVIVGDADFGEVGTLRVESSSEIDGTLKYSSSNKATVPSGVSIGKVEYTKSSMLGSGYDWVAILLGLVSMIVTSLVFVAILPKFTKNVIDNTLYKPWLKFFVGLGTFLIVPISFIILLIVSIITMGVGLELTSYLLLPYAAFISLASTITALLVGSLVWKYLMKESDYVVNWKNALIGVAIVNVVGLIPYVGPIIILIVACAIFGALTVMAFEYLKQQRISMV